MCPQLAHLQPNPGIVRLLFCTPLRIFQCFIRPAAVHQGHRIPVIPGSAACGVFLGIFHPFRCFAVISVLIQIIVSKGIPEGDLKILAGLLFAEPSFFYTVFNKIIKPTNHFPKVTSSSFIKGRQCLDVLCREQGAGFLMNLRFRFPLPQADCSRIPAEHMEHPLGHTRICEEILCRLQHGGQVPGDEVQIPVVQSSRAS